MVYPTRREPLSVHPSSVSVWFLWYAHEIRPNIDRQPRLTCGAYNMTPIHHAANSVVTRLHCLCSSCSVSTPPRLRLHRLIMTPQLTCCNMHNAKKLAKEPTSPTHKPGEINCLPNHHEIFSLFKIGPAP